MEIEIDRNLWRIFERQAFGRSNSCCLAAGVIQLNEALDVLSFPSYWNKGVALLNCAIISSKAGKDKVGKPS